MEPFKKGGLAGVSSGPLRRMFRFLGFKIVSSGNYGLPTPKTAINRLFRKLPTKHSFVTGSEGKGDVDFEKSVDFERSRRKEDFEESRRKVLLDASFKSVCSLILILPWWPAGFAKQGAQNHHQPRGTGVLVQGERHLRSGFCLSSADEVDVLLCTTSVYLIVIRASIYFQYSSLRGVQYT